MSAADASAAPDDGDREPPDADPLVFAAVAFGLVPLPFLGLYTLLFLLHGLLVPVQPPDITTTRGGEALAGFVTLALLVALCFTIAWFLGRRRRWPFALGQLATLVAAGYFLAGGSSGSPIVPALLLVTSATALVLMFLPVSWTHLGKDVPDLRQLRRVRVRRPSNDT